MTKRLSHDELRSLTSDQLTARAVTEIWALQLRRDLGALDPDLPPATLEAKRTRLLREYRDKVDAKHREMQARWATITDQANFYKRTDVLRRASTDPRATNITAVVQRASDASLLQLAQDAAADDDRYLAGAVQMELANRTVPSAQLREFAAAFKAISFPELDSLEHLFKQVGELYLRSELEALALAPNVESVALRTMELGRELDSPVLSVDRE